MKTYYRGLTVVFSWQNLKICEFEDKSIKIMQWKKYRGKI